MSQVVNLFFLTCVLPQILSFQPKKIYQSQPKTHVCRKQTILDKNAIIATTDNYKDLIQSSNVFVDKSFFIRDLLMGTAQATVFSTPPGWGKTTLLNMLRTFFEFKLDAEYEIDENRTAYDTYALFTKGEVKWTTPSQVLLTPLLISDHDDIIQKHFGRYPVIYLSFKNVTGSSWYEIWSGIRNAVTEAFRQHVYMIACFKKAICDPTRNRNTKDKLELEMNLRQFQIYSNGSEMRRVPMRKSIRFLSEMLNWYYHRPVFLFVDDFDMPLLNIFHYPHMLQQDITKLSTFMADFYEETFRRYAHIKKSILTGTFSIENITQFPTKVKKYNFITNPFPYMFGFTSSEVEAIFNGLRISPEVLSQATDWYDGYRVGLLLDTHVYTPTSVVRYLKLRDFRNFYERRQKIDILEHMMNLKPLRFSFERLLNGYEIPIPLPKLNIDGSSLIRLGNLVHLDYGDNITVKDWHSAMGYLYAAGYLTAVSNEVYNTTKFIVLHVRLVNRQIREEIMDKLFSRYHYDYGISVDMVRIAVDQLVKFAMNDDKDSVELSRRLRLIYHSCDNLFVNETDQKMVQRTTQFVFSMLNFIFLMTRRMHQFSGQVFDELSKPDMFMYREKRAVVLDIKFINTDDACDLLQRTKQYEDLEELFERCKDVETVKFIAIDINPQKDVQICAEVRSINRR